MNNLIKPFIMKRYFLFAAVLIMSGLFFTGCKEDYRLFVGGFTTDTAKGLSVFDFNSRNGDLKLISESDVGPNPSYFCYSGGKKLIYVLNEVMEFNGNFGGGLDADSIWWSLFYFNVPGQ
jgi:hypothetical protein